MNACSLRVVTVPGNTTSSSLEPQNAFSPMDLRSSGHRAIWSFAAGTIQSSAPSVCRLYSRPSTLKYRLFSPDTTNFSRAEKLLPALAMIVVTDLGITIVFTCSFSAIIASSNACVPSGTTKTLLFPV